MSALNNQSDQTDAPQGATGAELSNEALTALRAILRSPKQQVSEPMLRAAGVDVDMLVEMFDKDIKPYLDFLDGYRDIRTLDPQGTRRSVLRSRWDDALQAMVAPEPWDHVLTRSGVHERTVDMQALWVVPGARFYCFRRELGLPEEVELTVFLTRKGQWVLWYAIPERGRSSVVKSEQVFWFESVRELWEKLYELVPDDYRLDYDSGGVRGKPGYLPLLIESHLRRVLNATIDIREGRLNTMKAALKEANARVGTVTFPHRS